LLGVLLKQKDVDDRIDHQQRFFKNNRNHRIFLSLFKFGILVA